MSITLRTKNVLKTQPSIFDVIPRLSLFLFILVMLVCIISTIVYLQLALLDIPVEGDLLYVIQTGTLIFSAGVFFFCLYTIFRIVYNTQAELIKARQPRIVDIDELAPGIFTVFGKQKFPLKDYYLIHLEPFNESYYKEVFPVAREGKSFLVKARKRALDMLENGVIFPEGTFVIEGRIYIQPDGKRTEFNVLVPYQEKQTNQLDG